MAVGTEAAGSSCTDPVVLDYAHFEAEVVVDVKLKEVVK